MAVHVATVAAVLAAVLVTASGAQQARTVWRSPEVAGVSATGAGLVAVSCAGWLGYAWVAGLAVAAVSSGLGAVLWTITTVVVVRRRRQMPVAPMVWAAVLAAVAIWGGLAWLGVALVSEAVVGTVPQAWRVWRHATSAGVSTGAYSLMGTAAALWVGYAAVYGDAVLAVSQSIKTATCIAIVGRCVWLASRSRAADSLPGTVPNHDLLDT